MKVQQRHIKAISSKKTKQNQSSAFRGIFAAQKEALAPTIQKENTSSHHENSEAKGQPLKHILHELEEIMLHIERDSKDYRRAQMAINSLRDALHDMSDAFPLTAQDREEAKTLLIVESKRIDELQKYTR